VIEVRVRIRNGNDVQAQFLDASNDLVAVIARVDDDAFAGLAAAQNVAVGLQHADGKALYNHLRFP